MINFFGRADECSCLATVPLEAWARGGTATLRMRALCGRRFDGVPPGEVDFAATELAWTGHVASGVGCLFPSESISCIYG